MAEQEDSVQSAQPRSKTELGGAARFVLGALPALHT